MMWYDGPGRGFGLGEILFVFLWVAFAVLVVAVLIAALRWLWRTADRWGGGEAPKAPMRPDDPLEILRGRYARGEIDDEEYDRRRKILGG